MNHPSMNETKRIARPALTPCQPSAIRHLVRPVVCALIFALATPAGVLRAQTQAAADSLPDAQAGHPYSFAFTANGGTAPLTWGIVAGGLPDGLTLDGSSGALSGTPTVSRATPYTFTVEVTDSASAQREKFRKQFVLLVRERRTRPLSIATPTNGGTAASSSESSADRLEGPRQQQATTRAADEPEPEPTPECQAVDVESNSDALSIAVRNAYRNNPPDDARARFIDITDKQNPIRRPDQLIENTLGKCHEFEKDDYVIIHLVKWPQRDPTSGQKKYEPETEKWFLYSYVDNKWTAQKIQGGERIYGHKRVGVLLVHLTARDSWDIKYTVDVKRKTPGPIQNILDLAAIVAPGAGLASSRPTPPPSFWGGRLLLLQDVPADIVVKSDIVFVTGDNQAEQQSKVYSKTYDNEGRYHWDVSVGLPVKSFKEVQYDAEGGQVRAKEVNRQNAYGFLNVFFNPRGVDTKGDEFYKTPHLVLGVPISGKPLDRPMVGLGMGSYKTGFKFNLFGGIVFNRVREPQTLAAGQAATGAQLESDLRTRRVRKFIFGFNIPVKQFKDALTSKK